MKLRGNYHSKNKQMKEGRKVQMKFRGNYCTEKDLREEERKTIWKL